MTQIKLKLNSVLLIIAVLCAGIGYYIGYCSNKEQLYQVVNIIDGDTIEVKVGNKVEIVRLLGIDTPEIENPYKREECFGKEAKEKMEQILQKKRVYLLPDPKAPNRGKYGRLLRYVFLPNGEFVNAELVEQGYAFSYIYQEFQFMKYFGDLEKEAKEKKLGLWSEKCEYYK